MGNDKEKLTTDSGEDKPAAENNNTDNIQKEETAEKTKPEELRKVIKVNNDEQKPDQTKKQTEGILGGTDRGSLEQKRAILQSIKDFDFQIKKNQEEINALNQKLDSISKDLDDLVSLYEIVSEQMNPFVGLSKVTKKRIEALENFTKEVEELKTRIGDLEAFAEMAGADLNEIRKNRPDNANKTENTSETFGVSPSVLPNQNHETWASDDIEIIIEKALDSITFENKIDSLIDEFIENLKDMNTN